MVAQGPHRPPLRPPLPRVCLTLGPSAPAPEGTRPGASTTRGLTEAILDGSAAATEQGCPSI
jgi:hypothetical protein